MIKIVFRTLVAAMAFGGAIGTPARVVAVTPAFYDFRNLLQHGDWSAASGVSADGSTVVGQVLAKPWSGSPFSAEFDGLVWRIGEVPEIIQGPTYTGVKATSADGSVTVGATESFGGWKAFRRGPGEEMEPLGALDDVRTDSHPAAVSADGSVVTGHGYKTQVTVAEAFRWTESTGMVGLGGLPDGDGSSEAAGMSADGSVIVGRATKPILGEESATRLEAFRWTEASGMVGLGNLSGGEEGSIANGVSGDGAIVVGVSGVSGGDSRGFRWTESGGMIELPSLTPDSFSGAAAISADGSVIGGAGAGVNGLTAVVWNAQGKILRVADLLKKAGFDVERDGFRLKAVMGISADGTTLVGTAAIGSETLIESGWVAVLPRSVYVPEPCGCGVLACAASALMARWRGLRRAR